MSIVIGDAYQRMRVRAWHVKAWLGSFLNGSPASRRAQLADLRVALRRPLAGVTVEGLRLTVDLRDIGVGRPLFVGRSYEPDEVRFLRRHLRAGMTFADFGANLGYFTNLAAKLVGPTGTVVAVEPDPHNFRLLRRNCAANGARHARLFNVALGAAPGRARLFRARENLGDHHLYSGNGEGRPSVEVVVETVDRLWRSAHLPPPDVLKMDVQGFEVQVLRGMPEVLARPGPRLFLVEVWPLGLAAAGASVDEVFAAIEPHGFTPHLLGPDGDLCPTTRQGVAAALGRFDPALPEAAFVNVIFRRG